MTPTSTKWALMGLSGAEIGQKFGAPNGSWEKLRRLFFVLFQPFCIHSGYLPGLKNSFKSLNGSCRLWLSATVSEYVPVCWLACQPGAAARGGPGARRDAEKIDSRGRRCDVDGSSLGRQRQRQRERASCLRGACKLLLLAPRETHADADADARGPGGVWRRPAWVQRASERRGRLK